MPPTRPTHDSIDREEPSLDTLVPDNPWKHARYDDNGVLLNPDFINEIE